MIHPIPSGTRDVLPDEMRELRAITEAIRGVFEARGYGEIATPALEYEATLTQGDPAAADPAYKLFDEHGNVLILRSDMTIPIARVVASRYPAAEPPLRFCYFAHAYRSVRPQRGQAREMLQAGIELVGSSGPDGTAEALTVLCASLAAAGLENYRIGLGDASLYPRLLDRLAVAGRGAPAAPARAGHARLRRPRARGEPRSADARAAARPAAARRASTCSTTCREAAELRGGARPAGARRGRTGDLRPRPDPVARLLHGRGLRGLRRGARLPRSAAAAATTTCSAASAATLPASAGR